MSDGSTALCPADDATATGLPESEVSRGTDSFFDVRPRTTGVVFVPAVCLQQESKKKQQQQKVKVVCAHAKLDNSNHLSLHLPVTSSSD